MLQTVEAVVDEKGKVKTLEPLKLPKRRRALLTVLDEEPGEAAFNLTALSEAALAKDWLQPEEDEAWSHLAQLQSL